MDAKKRRPDHPDYDRTSIHIPEDAWRQFCGTMVQYWRMKQFNYEKVFFFRLGKFYEIFYHDAILCNRKFEMHWMSPNRKLHTGFPEKMLNKYIHLLTSANYTVAIVELTETSKEANARNIIKQNVKAEDIAKLSLEDQLKEKEATVAGRTIVSIYTKGTFMNTEDQSHEPQYVLAVSRDETVGPTGLGVCYFDVSTHECYLGTFTDDECFTSLRTIISKIRPVEIIYDPLQVTTTLERMLKNLPSQPIIHTVRPEQSRGINHCQGVIEKQVYSAADQQTHEPRKQHEILLKIRFKSEHRASILAFGIAATFLENQMLLKQIRFFEYRLFDRDADLKGNPFLQIDSQAIENLELVESQSYGSGKREGSLLEWIDHTKTPFGKRQIKKWLLSPLMDPVAIGERLEAVDDLRRIPIHLATFGERLKGLGDLEKMLSKVSLYSIKSAHRRVTFSNIQYTQMKQFKYLLDSFSKFKETIKPLRTLMPKFISRRLKNLLTFHHKEKNPEGLIPDMQAAITELDLLVEWRLEQAVPGVPGGEDKIPVPKAGICEQFDKQDQVVQDAKQKLYDHLEDIRKVYAEKYPDHKKLLGQIKFAHARYRFEVEIPDKLVEKNTKPSELIPTSQKTGFSRFQSENIRNLIDELEKQEDLMKEALGPFIIAIFQRFYEQRHLWKPAIAVLAELDCLQSMATASLQGKETMCKPRIVADVDSEGNQISQPFLNLVNMTHPGVKLKNLTPGHGPPKKKFIPNSTLLGTAREPAKALLVTGPNMGGKSTLLRQTCLAVILAQMGSFVPAESMEFTLVDRIFTRLGAQDRILEGKSTFFIEMEETKQILKASTNRSLAILDELGRGTSTFDGYAIAHAVLGDLIRRKQCRCLFATHYHMLLDDFRDCPGVACYNMACQEESEGGKIRFLYKFEKGECPKSFGMNVALMSGLSPSIVKRAQEKSEQLLHKIQFMSSIRADPSRSSNSEKAEAKQSPHQAAQLPNSTSGEGNTEDAPMLEVLSSSSSNLDRDEGANDDDEGDEGDDRYRIDEQIPKVTVCLEGGNKLIPPLSVRCDEEESRLQEEFTQFLSQSTQLQQSQVSRVSRIRK